MINHPVLPYFTLIQLLFLTLRPLHEPTWCLLPNKFCGLLTDGRCGWSRAGGGSSQNANLLAATEWLPPLSRRDSREGPARRVCLSFIPATKELSLLPHTIWLPACAARTMTHNRMCRQRGIEQKGRLFHGEPCGLSCLKSWGRAQKTWRKGSPLPTSNWQAGPSDGRKEDYVNSEQEVKNSFTSRKMGGAFLDCMVSCRSSLQEIKCVFKI